MFEGCGERVGLTNPALTLRLYYLPFRGPVGGGGLVCRTMRLCPRVVHTEGGRRPGAGEEWSVGRSLVVKREPQKVINGDPAPGDF